MFTRIRVQPALLRRPQLPLRSPMFTCIRVQPALLRRLQLPLRSPTIALITRQNHSNHTPDSYSKDVDHTPPTDAKIHRVDPLSENVQKPYEAPSGEWSRAGVKTDEYRSMEGQKQPYAPKGGVDTRYGARKTLAEDKGPETATSNEEPDEKSSHVRGG